MRVQTLIPELALPIKALKWIKNILYGVKWAIIILLPMLAVDVVVQVF